MQILLSTVVGPFSHCWPTPPDAANQKRYPHRLPAGTRLLHLVSQNEPSQPTKIERAGVMAIDRWRAGDGEAQGVCVVTGEPR